jgi:ribosomal-protein-alanine N-acetyltransferase
MSDSRLHVIMRPMILEDIDQVVVLDKLAFPSPWTARTYRYEVLDNEHARMFALQPADVAPQPAEPRPQGWLDRLLDGIVGRSNGQPALLIGYSGMWHIADEAHISTIAVHPDWRGKKLGELLVWSMVRQAIRQLANQVTLEVRVSNTLAQNLYYKYGFEILGTRKGYYRDNSEDAYMMGITHLDEAYREKMLHFGQELAQVLRVTDRW